MKRACSAALRHGRATYDPIRGTSMKSTLRLLSVAIGILLLSACVNLQVEKVDRSAQIDAPPSVDAPSYFLSKTGIAVVGTFTLNDCDGIIAGAGLAKGKHLDIDTPPIDLTEAFSVAVVNEVDRDYEYRIPLDKTRSWAKQLNLTIARNADKTLVSVNGTLADQAGPTLLAAAQTAIAIGGAIALPPAAPLIAGTAATAIKVEDKAAEAARARNFAKARDPQPKIYKTIMVKRKIRTEGPTPEFVSRNFCSDEVHAALNAIGAQQKKIGDLAAAAATKKKKAGAPDTAAQSDPAIIKAQAAIARIRVENNLTRTVRLVWTPSRADLVTASRDAHGILIPSDVVIVPKSYDLFHLVVASHWFSSKGVTAALTEAACVNGSANGCATLAPAGGVNLAKQSKAVARLVAPLTIELALKSWTLGQAYGEAPLDNSAKPTASRAVYDGIVYRDPALATIRVCQGGCGGELTPAITAGAIKPIAMPNGVSVRTDFENTLVETTADLATLNVPIAQYGRLSEVSMHSKLFETSIATLMQNPDGSIASIGTQSSNAAAAGFTAATAAANAQTSAIAARNTATTAANTALGAKAQFVDTVNKAIADCFAQQATITAQGGQPVGQCQ